MKKIGIFALLLSCLAAGSVQAQLRFGGLVMNHDIMMSTDFAQLSQTHGFGTARSMALGGAFTSLGADMASMSINPAGLGMFRRNEISLTPLLSMSGAETPGTERFRGNNKTRFSMANVGAALNVFESATSSLTSITLGFGMNRIADFNTRYSYSSESRYDNANPNHLMPTIADVFGQQLGQADIFPNDKGGLGYGNPVYWPAILGYNGYLISPVKDAAGNIVWAPDTIGHNASVLHSTDVINSGSINEFTLSMGMNLNNIVYLGASFGIQSVHKKQGTYYQEEYGYFDAQGKTTAAVYADGGLLESQLDYMGLYQESVLDGSGVNFKIGAIVRPTPNLRIGIAYHTPTFYSLKRAYSGDVESQLYNNESQKTQISTDDTPVQLDEGANSWDFVSPSRLMFGLSYTFGQLGLITVDYQRDWYNGIRVKNVAAGSDLSREFYKADFKQNFQATNTIRAGVEVKPLPILALRVGGGYTGSMFKNKALYINSPQTYKSYYVSAGAGVNLSANTVLDFAYQYLTNKQTQYELFFSQADDSGEMKTSSGLYDTKQVRHYLSLTLGFRF